MCPVLLFVLATGRAEAPIVPDPHEAWLNELADIDEELERAVVVWQAEIDATEPGPLQRWLLLRAREGALQVELANLQRALRLAALDEERRRNELESCTFDVDNLLVEQKAQEDVAEDAWRALEPQLGRRGEALRRWWDAWVKLAPVGGPGRAAQEDALAAAAGRARRALADLSPAEAAEARDLLAKIEEILALESQRADRAKRCAQLEAPGPLDLGAIEAQEQALIQQLSDVGAARARAEPAAMAALHEQDTRGATATLRSLGERLALAEDQLTRLRDGVGHDAWCRLHVDRALTGLLTTGLDQDRSLLRATASHADGCGVELMRWRHVEPLMLAWQLEASAAQLQSPARLDLALGQGDWVVDGTPVWGAGREQIAVKPGLHRVELHLPTGRVLVRNDELWAGARYAFTREDDRISLSTPTGQLGGEGDPSEDEAEPDSGLPRREEQIVRPKPPVETAIAAGRTRLSLGSAWGSYLDPALRGERGGGGRISATVVARRWDRLDLELGLGLGALFGEAPWCYPVAGCLAGQVHGHLGVGVRWDADATLRPSLSAELGGIPGVAPELGAQLGLDWRRKGDLFLTGGLGGLWTAWPAQAGAAPAGWNVIASAGVGVALGRP